MSYCVDDASEMPSTVLSVVSERSGARGRLESQEPLVEASAVDCLVSEHLSGIETRPSASHAYGVVGKFSGHAIYEGMEEETDEAVGRTAVGGLHGGFRAYSLEDDLPEEAIRLGRELGLNTNGENEDVGDYRRDSPPLPELRTTKLLPAEYDRDEEVVWESEGDEEEEEVAGESYEGRFWRPEVVAQGGAWHPSVVPTVGSGAPSFLGAPSGAVLSPLDETGASMASEALLAAMDGRGGRGHASGLNQVPENESPRVNALILPSPKFESGVMAQAPKRIPRRHSRKHQPVHPQMLLQEMSLPEASLSVSSSSSSSSNLSELESTILRDAGVVPPPRLAWMNQEPILTSSSTPPTTTTTTHKKYQQRSQIAKKSSTNTTKHPISPKPTRTFLLRYAMSHPKTPKLSPKVQTPSAKKQQPTTSSKKSKKTKPLSTGKITSSLLVPVLRAKYLESTSPLKKTKTPKTTDKSRNARLNARAQMLQIRAKAFMSSPQRTHPFLRTKHSGKGAVFI